MALLVDLKRIGMQSCQCLINHTQSKLILGRPMLRPTDEAQHGKEWI